MARKSTKKAEVKIAPLCVFHETPKMQAELHREGDGFRVHFAGTSAPDRKFESLPALLQGLQSVFLELRMAGPGLRGLGSLAKAQDDARQDVLAASRKIHAALKA
jgi:hypothetical protein